MTGAPVPQGADTVIRVEDTSTTGDVVEIRDDRDARSNVRVAGEDVRAGVVVMRAGTTLGAAQIGVLSSVGCARPHVHRRPRVAILATGDELVPVERFADVLAGRRIVSSNSYSLEAAVRAAGGEPVATRIGADDPDALAQLLRGAEGCDVIITSGGVSVGDFDFTRDVVGRLGGTLSLWRVRMRPGRAPRVRPAVRRAVARPARESRLGARDVRAVRTAADPDAARIEQTAPAHRARRAGRGGRACALRSPTSCAASSPTGPTSSCMRGSRERRARGCSRPCRPPTRCSSFRPIRYSYPPGSLLRALPARRRPWRKH